MVLGYYKAEYKNPKPGAHFDETYHCPMCVADEKVFCPRDADAMCMHCGEGFCGAHIGPHLNEVHCVALNLDHCRKE